MQRKFDLMDKDGLNLILGTLYIAVMIFGLGSAIFALSIEKRRKSTLKSNLKQKINSEIDLTASDIISIGKAFNLSPNQSRKVLYGIYGEINDKDGFSKLKNLVLDLEKEEPLDNLPEEVKPSMLRLQELSESSNLLSDKSILAPISHALNKYVELQIEEIKLRKKTNRAWLLTITSFIIGLVSFYFTATAPTADDIASKLQQLNIEQTDGS